VDALLPANRFLMSLNVELGLTRTDKNRARPCVSCEICAGIFKFGLKIHLSFAFTTFSLHSSSSSFIIHHHPHHISRSRLESRRSCPEPELGSRFQFIW
jgi:hypothetical protein